NQQYGRPPPFGGFPGQGAPPGMGPPPGMALPPGMSAPGVTPPPGMQSASQQPGRSGSNFQPPPSLPSNINFNAPVIRLGTTGPAKPSMPMGDAGRRDNNAESRSGRPGLGAGMGMGMEAQRQALRENMMQLAPPTKEEILKTIFVGGITEGMSGDDGVERILQCAGNLRRWIRAMDADNKACRFGFAEYEDPDSLSTAVDVLKEVEVPVKQQLANGVKEENGDDVKVEKTRLLIMVDDASLNYLDQYRASRGDQDPIQAQLRLDAAKSALATVLSELADPSSRPVQNHDLSNLDRDGDSSMQNGEEKPDGEIVTIPLTVDDELSDIPAEMRETVAREIAAFRDRSTRRDMERLRREEEMEAAERQRATNQTRSSRLASPPSSAPTGPAGGANGVPVGPRDRGVLNAPAGPKGYQSSQMPRDLDRGVTFVNGTGINGAAGGLINRADEDSDASDEELEQRRKDKKEAELEKQYQDQRRRWLNRERSRTAALEREKERDKQLEAAVEADRVEMERQLRTWDDDVQAKSGEEYYIDRSMWIRKRAAFRSREASQDELDRSAEDREKAKDVQKQEQARGMADDFLNRQAMELDAKAEAPREPQRFKLSLGAAAQKAQAAASTKRTVADVEGLLEDEEEADTTAKRTLIPIKFDNAADAMGLTEEERAQAARQLAADIPSDKEGLWKWPVQWEFVEETVLTEQLRPFVEKKIMEYLGVQEQMLVEAVEGHVRKRGTPQSLVDELEGDTERIALLRSFPSYLSSQAVLMAIKSASTLQNSLLSSPHSSLLSSTSIFIPSTPPSPILCSINVPPLDALINMLSSIAATCFTAALLSTSSLASSIAIAFGNPSFDGITFGHPYSITWFGGNGSPATIRLLTGNAAALSTIATLATDVTASPYTWTPVASQNIPSGQMYALSIEQSGLTNYSPMFGIGQNAAFDDFQVQYGVPVPIGFGRYYPLKNRAAPEEAKVHNTEGNVFNTGAVFPRTEGVFHQTHATGTPIGTGVIPAYATGTPAGSKAPHAYATGTSTGSVSGLRAADMVPGMAPQPIIEHANGAPTMNLGWPLVAQLISMACVSVLRWN
ncbi:MAG: hypothetical protein LQ341_005488, partial [Variospora aurantia]